MEVSHTKTSQRILIWIIAIVMAGGFIGSYFLIMMSNEDQAQDQLRLDQLSQEDTVENTTKPDPSAYVIKKRATKLEVTDLKVGTGPAVKSGDTLTVHYKGTLAQSGMKFESSYDRGEPATFALTGVIEGWQEGLPGMKVGGKRRLVIPADMAYGQLSRGGIPADSDLVFEVELLKISPTQEQ